MSAYLTHYVTDTTPGLAPDLTVTLTFHHACGVDVVLPFEAVPVDTVTTLFCVMCVGLMGAPDVVEFPDLATGVEPPPAATG